MTNLGLVGRDGARSTLRAIGAVLLLLGVAGVVAGAAFFAKGALSDDMEAMGRFALVGIALFGGGGLLAVTGLGLLNAGLRGTRYVSAETLPVVTDPTALFADEQRLDP